MKTAEISLPYFKQGDDLSQHLRRGLTPLQALVAHAQQLDEAAEMLRRIEDILTTAEEIEIQAECHTIMISSADEMIAELIEKDLATSVSDDDDVDDEWWEDEYSEHDS
jgi:hypothetical protein